MADETKTAEQHANPPSKSKAPKKPVKPENPAALAKGGGDDGANGTKARLGIITDKGQKAPESALNDNISSPNEAMAGTAPTAAELLGDDLGSKKIVKIKGAKNIVIGVATIVATFNNTHVSISDMQGNVIGWSSAGRVGFKGSRKSTAYAAQQVAQDAGRQAMSHGLREVEVRVKGPGSGRESAIRALQAIGLDISTIKDITPIPHNGCRPRKKRRV